MLDKKLYILVYNKYNIHNIHSIINSVIVFTYVYLGPYGPGAPVVGEAEHGVGAPVGLHPISI